MNVYVVGAGSMGAGIAQCFITKGMEVLLYDGFDGAAEAGQERIAKQLARLVAKERMSQADADAAMGRLQLSGHLEEAKDADLVVEAIIEDVHAKRTLFQSLDQICKPECLFASNTSSLSITELARDLEHESQIVGLHFFNPAPLMKLIELIPGVSTSPDTIAAALQIIQKIGKEPVLSMDSPGFIVNRLLIPLINEAAMILSQQLASAEDIDKAMRLGANHPLGPLALGDLVGLDVVLAIMETLQRETGDSKYRPAMLLKRMVRAGRLGRKTGEGFFKYDR